MSRIIVEYDGKTLLINNKRKILIGGEIHYFRIPEELWEERLVKIKQAGCNLVTTYIPWNFHEEKEGELNWNGNKNLPKFLELCKKYGLYVIIKPGPYICAEWDFGGFPHWLLEKDIPLRVPDKKYLQIVKKWYKEIAKIIKPFLITNGGNIILIQVENEYDHLIEETKLVKNKKVAKEYLLTLLKFLRDAGINIPAFTNEGRCILGTEIINTHTYYPNIPWIWMWEFNDFDRKIEESRKLQPDKPLMILELEAGWFAQYGQPLYEVETELTEAITKTVIAYGASVFNYYMMVGGTSFPYWPTKGDFGGNGICTTFDFGAAPIREWGEIHTKYHIIRNYAYFLQSFPEIIFEGEIIRDADFYNGGENIVRVYKHKAEVFDSFQDSYENVKLLQRRCRNIGIILLRNLEEESKYVQIIFNSQITGTELVFPENRMKLKPHSALLLPIDFCINADIQIIYTTSEVIAKKKINGIEYIIFKGDKKIPGEIVLNCNDKIEVINGNIKEAKFRDEYKKIIYSHNEINIIKIGNIVIMILPESEATKLWINDDFIMISDFYYLAGIDNDGNGIRMKFQVKSSDTPQRILIWGKDDVKAVEVEGRNIEFNKMRNHRGIEFEYKLETKTDKNKVFWLNNWKYSPDTEEKLPEYNDSEWNIIDGSTPLEKARYFKHGYYWYRAEFSMDSKAKKVRIKINTNNMDRFTLYINGKFRWIGIGSPELDITDMIKKGKNIIAICYDNAYHTKAHPHEGPIKKMSGLYLPVKITWVTENNRMEYVIRQWKIKEGLNGVIKGYYLPEFDEKNWNIIPQAEKYVFEEDIGNIIWLRRWFIYKKAKNWKAPLYLEIEKLKDRCLIYVNGFLLGKYEDIGPQHKFYIPENLLKEKNLLAIIIEGPGFHPVKQFGFQPPKFKEIKLGFYYKAKNIEVKLRH